MALKYVFDAALFLMDLNKKAIKDIIEWDIKNWSTALQYWSKHADIESKENMCLELGGRSGGLSLWLAMNGNRVICSDLHSPKEQASILHAKYGLEDEIEYRAINATDIPFENKFDVVVFKSILGGVSGNGRDELKKKMIDEIYKSLKPNGKLLFAENLESSFIHKFLRNKCIKWGGRWNYLDYKEIDDVFASFEHVQYKTTGFFAAFGRRESQRNLLASIDELFKPFIPEKSRYIVYGIAEKKA